MIEVWYTLNSLSPQIELGTYDSWEDAWFAQAEFEADWQYRMLRLIANAGEGDYFVTDVPKFFYEPAYSAIPEKIRRQADNPA